MVLSKRTSDAATAIARIVMGACFMAYGIEKLWVIDGTIAYIGARLPYAPLVFWLAVLIEAGLGSLVVIGYKARETSLFLACYCAFVATVFHTDLLFLLFHTQSSIPDAKGLATPIGDHFYSNIMIAAGFLSLFATGPGAMALDGRPGEPGVRREKTTVSPLA